MVAYFPLQNRTNSLYFSLLAGNPRGGGLARDYSLYQPSLSRFLPTGCSLPKICHGACPGNSANFRRKSFQLDMSNQRVSIIERVKRNGKWVWGEKWELPVKFTVKQGSRQGKFYVLWYRGANKVLTPVPKRKGGELPDLGAALWLAKVKQRHLEDAADGLQRPDPITPVNRVTIREAVQK